MAQASEVMLRQLPNSVLGRFECSFRVLQAHLRDIGLTDEHFAVVLGVNLVGAVLADQVHRAVHIQVARLVTRQHTLLQRVPSRHPLLYLTVCICAHRTFRVQASGSSALELLDAAHLGRLAALSPRLSACTLTTGPGAAVNGRRLMLVQFEAGEAHV